MKLKFKKATSDKTIGRLKKKMRIRKKVNGDSVRPRLCVYRSGSHMYAQVIDDERGTTLVSASSLKLTEKLSGKAVAEKVGEMIAREALAKDIKKVVFDRNGFIFHGRVKALADSARNAGLDF